jgi:GTPase SAR1 family protein
MEIFTIIFGFASLILGILSYNLNVQKEKRERTLEKFRSFSKSLTMIEPMYVDVVLFGPRRSGKTSIVKLWTSPWTQIDQISSSNTWHVYEKDIFEFEEESQINPDIEVEQTYQSILRLRVHDYPGEDSYRTQAIKDMEDLGEKAVLVFVLHVEYANNNIQSYNENAAYFSVQFTETVLQQIKNVSTKVAKVFIVFNKIDLLPSSWTETKMLEELKNANHDAIYQIERLFSTNLEYHLISAKTNVGLIRLLGSIGIAGIKSKREQKIFRRQFEQIAQEFKL